MSEPTKKEITVPANLKAEIVEDPNDLFGKGIRLSWVNEFPSAMKQDTRTIHEPDEVTDPRD